MKKFSVIFFLVIIAFTLDARRTMHDCYAGDAAVITSPDLLLANIKQAYETKNTEMLNTCLWYNSSRHDAIMSRAKDEFSRYDTITLTLKPLSTVFYRKMGYDYVEIQSTEEFRGFDIKKNTGGETVCQSKYVMFKDENGRYYLLSWERKPKASEVKIHKD